LPKTDSNTPAGAFRGELDHSETWSAAQLASIHKMLRPKSVAVIGATPRMNYGGRFMARVINHKDQLRLYPVNPNYDEVMGSRCYASIADLPEVPDLAAIVVPYQQVLPTLKACHEKGVGSAIIISAGFAERDSDDRRDLQGELGAFACKSGLRFSGPNCLGLANITDNLWLTASNKVLKTPKGSIGLICQSGATLFGPVLARAEDAGIGFSVVVSTGNEADLGFADYARYLLDDPETKVIAGFIEGFKDAAKVIEVAKLAAERGKPLVLIKIGRSELGARAARSHTASLTGSDALYDSIFAQYGIIRVASYDDLLEVSHVLAHMPKPTKPGLAVVSHSGGISSLTADMCGQAGLNLPVLGKIASDGINGILKGFGWAANPADVTGYANSESFPAIMDFMINEPQVGALVAASAGNEKQAAHVIALRDRSDKGVAFMWTGGRKDNPSLAMYREANIPVFYGPDSLARSLAHLYGYHAWRDKRLADGFATAPVMSAEQHQAVAELKGFNRSTLTESESKSLISAWSIPVNGEERVQSAVEAVQAAERIGYPVAMKVESPDILHKTEAGIVRLSLGDAAAVREAHVSILAAAKSYAPNAEITGVLIQEMVSGGTEVIVGVSVDPQLGPTLLFGSGGVMVEVYGDVALRNCPITAVEARDMLSEVKGTRLLEGFRGQPAGDIDALVQVLVNVSHMASNLDGQIAELDINPLIVLPAGQGVKAVDALVVFKDESAIAEC
jgi:acyl-CoA synthetase (NDP forming)